MFNIFFFKFFFITLTYFVTKHKSKRRQVNKSWVVLVFISCPIIRCSPQSRPRSRSAVALRLISPHCQAVVNRKRETKAERDRRRRRRAPDVLNTMLQLLVGGFTWRSQSAARCIQPGARTRTSSLLGFWSDRCGLNWVCRSHPGPERHGVTSGYYWRLRKRWQAVFSSSCAWVLRFYMFFFCGHSSPQLLCFLFPLNFDTKAHFEARSDRDLWGLQEQVHVCRDDIYYREKNPGIQWVSMR